MNKLFNKKIKFKVIEDIYLKDIYLKDIYLKDIYLKYIIGVCPTFSASFTTTYLIFNRIDDTMDKKLSKWDDNSPRVHTV